MSWLGVTAPGRRRSRQPGERRRKLRRQRGWVQGGHSAGRPLQCVCHLRSRGQYFVPTLYLDTYCAENTAFWLVRGGDCSLPIGQSSQHTRPWVSEVWSIFIQIIISFNIFCPHRLCIFYNSTIFLQRQLWAQIVIASVSETPDPDTSLHFTQSQGFIYLGYTVTAAVCWISTETCLYSLLPRKCSVQVGRWLQCECGEYSPEPNIQPPSYYIFDSCWVLGETPDNVKHLIFYINC